LAYLGSDLTSGDTITGLPLDVNLKKARNSGLAVNLSDGQRITLWDTVNEVRETVTVDGAQSAGNQKSSIAISSHTLSHSFVAENTAIVMERSSDNRRAFLGSTNSSALKALYLGRLFAREGAVSFDRTLYTSGYSVTGTERDIEETLHADHITTLEDRSNRAYPVQMRGGQTNNLGAPIAQPSLSGMDEASWLAWIDEANDNLVFEVKDSSGATLSGTVSLS
jgi:hypothetical protein